MSTFSHGGQFLLFLVLVYRTGAKFVESGMTYLSTIVIMKTLRFMDNLEILRSSCLCVSVVWHRGADWKILRFSRHN